MNKQNPQYVHISMGMLTGGTMNHGGITVAYTRSALSGEFDGLDKVVCGVAYCSEEDAYVKATGRDVATNRIGQFTIPVSSNAPKGDIIRQVFKHLRDTHAAPNNFSAHIVNHVASYV